MFAADAFFFWECPHNRVSYPVVTALKVDPECPKKGVNDNGKVPLCSLRTAWNPVSPSLRTIRVDPECPNSRVTYLVVRAVRRKRGRPIRRSRRSKVAVTLDHNDQVAKIVNMLSCWCMRHRPPSVITHLLSCFYMQRWFICYSVNVWWLCLQYLLPLLVVTRRPWVSTHML